MNIYETDKIRNVVLLGHGGAGKTTLTEAMAFVSGITKRMGKVTDGNTISDFDKEETKRQFSISTSLVPIEWEGYKMNVLDTPGYFDFVGEAEEAVAAADAAVIVINGKAGVEVGTEKAWELCEKNRLPVMFFVTGMDDDHASFKNIMLVLNEKFGRKVAPFYVPMRENEKFVGHVNLVKMKGRRFVGETSEFEECDIPDYLEIMAEAGQYSQEEIDSRIGEVIRATLESLCYQVNDVLQVMEEDSGIELSSLKVDGGASANNFLLQVQADMIDAPVKRPDCIETTAIGAAYLAGLAVGYWKSKEEVLDNWKINQIFEPQITKQERKEREAGWKKAVACSFGWNEDEE